MKKRNEFEMDTEFDMDKAKDLVVNSGKKVMKGGFWGGLTLL